MNTDKCFTSGQSGVPGPVNASMSHSDEFRLVGGSFVYRLAKHVSELEVIKEFAEMDAGGCSRSPLTCILS